MFGVRGSGFGVQGSGFGVRGSGLGGEGRGARGEGAMQRVGRGTGLSHREIGEEMALPCLALIRRPPRTSALDLGVSGLCPCPVFDAGLTPRTPSPPPRQPGAPVVTPPGDLPPDIALSLRPPSPSPPSSSPSRRHRRAAPAASVAVVTFAVVACVSSLSVQRGVTLCASFPPPLRLRRVLPCELATPWYVHAFCLEVSVLSWCRGVVVSVPSWCCGAASEQLGAAAVQLAAQGVQRWRQSTHRGRRE